MTKKKTDETSREYQVSGKELFRKLKELVHQGNVRHIVIRNDKGRTLIEIPLNIGIIGTVLAPPWAAVGAIAALAAKCTIVVKTDEEAQESP